MLIIKNSLEEIIENYSIKDLNIPEIVPNYIDNYLIYIDEDGHHTLHLPLNEVGTQFKNWKKSRGGIFSNDVLNFCIKKSHGKYIQIKGNGINFIARLVSESEEDLFKSLKLIDGKVKDIPYMILRNLDETESLTNIKSSITINDFITEPDETINITPLKINTQDDDFEPIIGSISLFND